MATNMYKKYTESLCREWAVAVGTVAGDPVKNLVSLEVGVALTSRGDAVSTINLPGGMTLTGFPTGGIGNRDGGAVVATDGSWLLTVPGVVACDTGSGGAGTDEGTAVFIEPDGDLSLTSAGNTFFGVIDDGVIIGTVAPVKIGIAL